MISPLTDCVCAERQSSGCKVGSGYDMIRGARRMARIEFPKLREAKVSQVADLRNGFVWNGEQDGSQALFVW